MNKTAYRTYLASDYWQHKRAEFVKAANFTCEACGVKTFLLDCHHLPIGYKYLGLEERHHVQVLCRACHQSRHAK